MEAKQAESVLFGRVSTREQRFNAFMSWWNAEFERVGEGHPKCEKNDCLMCSMLEEADDSLRVEQFLLFLRILGVRDPDRRPWVRMVAASASGSSLFPQPPA